MRYLKPLKHFLPIQSGASLISLFAWSETEFLDKTAGSPIRRIGYDRWLRNIAIGLGNAPWSEAVESALWARRAYPSALVREHIAWALEEQRLKRGQRIATDSHASQRPSSLTLVTNPPQLLFFVAALFNT